jgi:hypothetical protein
MPTPTVWPLCGDTEASDRVVFQLCDEELFVVGLVVG